MRKTLMLALALLLLPSTVFAAGTVYSNVSFQVKGAVIDYTDNGVWVEFTFFENDKLHDLSVPAKILGIEVKSISGTQLIATYEEICASMYLECSRTTKGVTLHVSNEKVAKKWREKLNEVQRVYEEMKRRDVLPTIEEK